MEGKLIDKLAKLQKMHISNFLAELDHFKNYLFGFFKTFCGKLFTQRQKSDVVGKEEGHPLDL